MKTMGLRSGGMRGVPDTEDTVGDEDDQEGEWLEGGRSRAEVAGTHEFCEGEGPAWLMRREGDGYDVISADDTVAQV
jgi:hypothetical protein